ncbi:DUF433 domain-containing protein [Kribbella sp. CA-245084]|uniref:DUF433 domain-containing protein n=1 Tax=Kribbella sp. CA-245084 TaxID=3239940 RepID=UPI003D941F60
MTDLLRRPGQHIIAALADVFRPFVTSNGVEVPDFKRPRPGLVVDPAIQGGHPVIAGTRVPFDDVASLMHDVPAENIKNYYPNVAAAAALDALDFHRSILDPRRPQAA